MLDRFRKIVQPLMKAIVFLFAAQRQTGNESRDEAVTFDKFGSPISEQNSGEGDDA